MKIISTTPSNELEIITITQNYLRKGGLVIFPSDTVYGALVDATQEKGVKKLIAFKNRPAGKPISVFLPDIHSLEKFVSIDKKKKNMLTQLLPGPFTVILTSLHKVSRLLESEKGTLGIRLPHYFLLAKLMSEFGKPVTATSANLSGRSPHYSVQTLLEELPQVKKSTIDLVVDAGKLPRNKPSTIIDLTTDTLKILRKGDLEMSKTVLSYISHSPAQTRAIGRHFLQKYLLSIPSRPLVCIIKGEVGVGKTVFVKGIGEKLGIDNIISPTYIICDEYKIADPLKMMYHFDFYKIEEKEEFKYLGINAMLRPGNLLCFEWGDRAGDITDMLKKNATVVFITMSYLNEKERQITFSELAK